MYGCVSVFFVWQSFIYDLRTPFHTVCYQLCLKCMLTAILCKVSDFIFNVGSCNWMFERKKCINKLVVLNRILLTFRCESDPEVNRKCCFFYFSLAILLKSSNYRNFDCIWIWTNHEIKTTVEIINNIGKKSFQ